MGLFSRSKKNEVTPSITVDGIEVFYDPKQEEWLFFYRDNDFLAYCPKLQMPSRDQLDSILSEIETLKPEMIERLREGWKVWEEVSVNDGETYSINIEQLADEGVFEVWWRGGETWGDMLIAFKIKDGIILEEEWGD